jgi:hypothetical protein
MWIFSTSPPVSPSPYEVVKGEGEKKKEGLAPLFNTPHKELNLNHLGKEGFREA